MQKNIIYADTVEKFSIPDYKDIGEVYQRFLDWFLENGGKMTGVQWPAYFGKNDLRGIIATRDLKPYESLIYAPNKFLITSKLAQDHEIIGPIIKEYPVLFEEHDDFEFYIQIIFLMYERIKGKDSFWYPYFELQPIVDTPVEWGPEDLDFIEDPSLIKEIEDCKTTIAHDFLKFARIIKEHQDIFVSSTFNDFLWAYQFVTSRCFGCNLPYDMLIPMVDLVNHDHVKYCETEILNVRHERELDRNFLKSIDYRKMIKKYDLTYMIPEHKFIPGIVKENMVHFIYYYQKFFDEKSELSLQHIIDQNLDDRQEQLSILLEKLLSQAEEMDIWDIPDMFYSDTEDNDSSEEEEEEDTEYNGHKYKSANKYHKNCLELNKKLNPLIVRNEKVNIKPVKKEFKEDKVKANESKKQDYNEISLTKEIKEKPTVNTFKEDLQQDCTKIDQDLFMEEIQKEIREEVVVKAQWWNGNLPKEENFTKKNQIELSKPNKEVTENIGKAQDEQGSQENTEEKSLIDSESTAITETKCKVIYQADNEKKYIIKKASPEKNGKTYLDSKDLSSEESDTKEKFDWYCTKDEDVYYMLANNDIRQTKKNDQVFISYGKRTNRYLLCWYGFSMKYNVFDSVGFRINQSKLEEQSFNIHELLFYDFISEQDYNNKFCYDQKTKEKIELENLSKEFKTKESCINIDLVNFFRSAFTTMHYKKYNQCPGPGKRMNPENLNLELLVFQGYIIIFGDFLKIYKRDLNSDIEMYDDDSLNWKKRMVLNIEMNYKKIAAEQIFQASVIIDVQKGLIDGSYKTVREGYMNCQVNRDLSKIEMIKKVVKIRTYLQSLENLQRN